MSTISNEDLKAEVGRKIIEALTNAEVVFTIEGTPMVTIKDKSGQYKNKPLVPGAEFLAKDCYVGKRKQLIFIFAPVDAQEFTVEIPVDKMDDVFGAFMPEVVEALGLDDQEFSHTTHLVAQLTKALRKEKEEAAEVAGKNDMARKAAHYANNPNFGRF
jgi:hypothetical protein